MQSSRMSIMSVSKISDNSENQTKHCMIQFANNENLLRSTRCLSFYQFILFYWKKILQKVLVVVIGVLHDMMVKCHLLRRKNDVICVRHEMKMKGNLMRQTNRCGSFRVFPTKMVRYIGHTSFLERKSIFRSCITMKFHFFSLIDSRMGSMGNVSVRRGLIECNYT